MLLFFGGFSECNLKKKLVLLQEIRQQGLLLRLLSVLLLFFLISSSATLFETRAFWNSKKMFSSILFSINIGDTDIYDDPILKLYTNAKN
jgi:hypothetical protein